MTRRDASCAGAYIGVMSGTSMDAVDAVLVDIDAEGRCRAINSANLPLPSSLKRELLALNTPGQDELHRAAQASLELGRLYAQTVKEVLSAANIESDHIEAIGVHGQTVRHRPDLGYTLQLNAPALVAELTGIDVIADFRSRDMAAGGQGAPLVPAFHAAQFTSDKTRVILNLGGIANITILRPTGGILGFDTGPANMLMDAWMQRHRGQAYDAHGQWAASGTPIPALLTHMLADPWFQQAPPKSTGRDDFNMDWLEQQLQVTFGGTDTVINSAQAAADIQATLLQLTAQSIAVEIARHAPDAEDVLVCGGGALNNALMQALAEQLPCRIDTTEKHGLPAQWVEGAAFAWLAWCHDARKAAGLPPVTGARSASILGCRYLA